jgi:hypothetical protein
VERHGFRVLPHLARSLALVVMVVVPWWARMRDGEQGKKGIRSACRGCSPGRRLGVLRCRLDRHGRLMGRLNFGRRSSLGMAHMPTKNSNNFSV